MNKILYHTEFLDLKSTESASGHDWFYVHRTNDIQNRDSAVAITLIVKKDGIYNYLILKTLRPPINAENKAKFCLESPAGLIGDIDKNEDLLAAAKKELLEETGYIADKMYFESKNLSSSSGLTSETLSFVTAISENDKTASEPMNDGGVIVERIFIPCDKVYETLNSFDYKEYSVSSALLAGLYFAQNRFKNNLFKI